MRELLGVIIVKIISDFKTTDVINLVLSSPVTAGPALDIGLEGREKGTAFRFVYTGFARQSLPAPPPIPSSNRYVASYRPLVRSLIIIHIIGKSSRLLSLLFISLPFQLTIKLEPLKAREALTQQNRPSPLLDYLLHFEPC